MNDIKIQDDYKNFEPYISLFLFKTETCVCCGKEIPEGIQVCYECGKIESKHAKIDRVNITQYVNNKEYI